NESCLSGGIAASLRLCRASAPAGCAAALAIAAAFGAPSAARAANTYLVTTAGDPGPMGTLSLRQAVASANTGDTVQFDASLSGRTITLQSQSGAIPISKAIKIQGPGPDVLTLNGSDTSRIFNVALGSPAHVFIDGLTLTHGSAPGTLGGAILVQAAYLEL